MQVSNPNNIKIYNLSAGKSLPDWLSDEKRRKLQKSDVDVQRRIELIQDFEMPAVSKCIQVSNDGQYVLATGTYKPRVRCYDVHEMALKFERGLDVEVVKFRLLADDYSKIVFLQDERFVEFHSQFGRYYRTRIPKYGRDLAYHTASCDMYFVGVGHEIFRLNLEHGRFLSPLATNATEINCCEFNPMHDLLACGTKEGMIECWDPRSRTRAGMMDTALGSLVDDLDLPVMPSVTALKFRDGLTVAVGTNTGHILMYDLRSNKPVLIKDHQYELPIKDLEFHDQLDLVLSVDCKILKLWERNTGKAYTAIEPGVDLNDLCQVPGSGLLFMANEAPKIMTYYIPSLGTAPRWCSFLDNLTEELEESNALTVYDDYKFVTRQELDALGLCHLIGSNLLRAYMHGFFMDIRLYHKAKAISDPFAYQSYRKSKIREKIEEDRTNRVQLKKLPKVNRNLAEKLMIEDEEGTNKKKKKVTTSIMKDDRFSALFSNPDFQIDTTSDEFRLLNPVVSKLDKSKIKKRKLEVVEQQFDEIEDEIEGQPSDEDSSSSDDEHVWTEEVKKQHRLLSRERKEKQWAERKEAAIMKTKFYEIKEGEEFKSLQDKRKQKELKKTLAERVEERNDDVEIKTDIGSLGNKEMTFTLKKSRWETKRLEESEKHHIERKKIRRSAHDITKSFKDKPRFWMGKRMK